MYVKDQLRIRMEELGMTPTELGRRIGVTGQTVRCWINGRNFPNKKLTPDIERELSFKLDYSEGATQHSNTVSDSIQNSAINALAAISKLPAPVQKLFHMLVEVYEQNHSALHQEAKMQLNHQRKGSTRWAKLRSHVNGQKNSDGAKADAVRVHARQPTAWSD